MVQPLFIQPARYLEKTAVEMRLPEDPNRWGQEILQELYKQVPYVADFEPHVEMDRADGEKGYGFGHISISNQTEAPAGSSPDQLQAAGIRNARIPIVIREGMLQPLDLLVTDDSKMVPLTEARLRQAIFRPQAFDVTARTPGDQSMIGQLYPPYRQNYGMGGGGIATSTAMGKQSSVFERYLTPLKEKNAGVLEDYFLGNNVRHGRLGKKMAEFEPGDGGLERFMKIAAATCPTCKKKMAECVCPGEKKASLLMAILPTINASDYIAFTEQLVDPEICATFTKNAAATASALTVLLRHDPSNAPKLASVVDSLLMPTATQLTRLEAGQYRVKTASHAYWRPKEMVIDRREALASFGEKIVLAADATGSVTMGVGADTQTEAPGPKPGPVTDSGMYKVFDTQGAEHIGIVIPSLIDVDGRDLPIALFTNGTVSAVQTDIVGIPAGHATDLPSGQPSGHGFFFKVEKGKICATLPLTSSGSTSSPGEPSDMQCETFDGRQVTVSQQPNIQLVMPSEDGKMLVPMDWRWSPLDKSQSIDLAGGEDDATKEADARSMLASVQIRSGGGFYDIDGLAVEKLAMNERTGLDLDGVLFMLAGLGVHPEVAVAKVAHATLGREPANVRVGRGLTPASEQEALAFSKAASRKVLDLKRDLVKEAAFLTDPAAVDTVLSIGFVNPENIQTFVSYLPAIDESQAHLCELLLASRLGLSEIPTGSLEKTVKSLEDVLEGLRVLAFTG